MGKFKLKLLFFVVLLILGISCREDSDLVVEDEQETVLNTGRYSKGKGGKIEEEEEFDDPVLLKKSTKNTKDVNTAKPNKDILEEQKKYENLKEFEGKKLHFAYYEVIMGLFVIIFIINCFIGKSKNENLAKKWYIANRTFFEDNYAHLGHGREFSTVSAPLLKESYNSFKFYASGRVFIKRFLARMEFKKRQDLVSLCTGVFLFNDKDRIIFDASLSPISEIPMVFCLCKKKETPNMKKNYSDIKHLASKADFYFLSDKLDLMTEDQEYIEEVFKDKTFRALYEKIQDHIDIIYFSDTQAFTSEPYGMFFSFDLDFSKKSPEELFADINLFVHAFIDQLCMNSSKISTQYKKAAEKRRTDYDKIKSKELQEKNPEEATRQNKIEKLVEKSKKATTPEQAQKIEEKLKKEQLKSQKKKQMKLIKK